MLVVHSFLYICSLRLGAILIGGVTLIQGCTMLMATILNFDDITGVKDFVLDILSSVKISDAVLELLNFQEETKVYMIGFGSYAAALAISSILVIFGAYQCKPNILYPFLLFYGLFLFIILGLIILLLLYLKAKNYGLGALILYSNLSVFIFLFYSYKWVCVYSLIKIINDLKARLINQTKKLPTLSNVRNTKAVPDVNVYNKKIVH